MTKIEAMAEALQFQRKANALVDKLSALIIKVPQKGNTESECQRLTLQTALNGLSRAINGTEWKDFIPKENP